MSLRFLMTLMLVTTIVVSGCASAPNATAKPTIVINEDVQGKIIDLPMGETLVVELKGNPTTGYDWEIDGLYEGLSFNGTDYVTDAGHKGEELTGAGGKKSFKFVAQRTGLVHLKFKEWRSWEGDSSVVRRFDVQINVVE